MALRSSLLLLGELLDPSLVQMWELKGPSGIPLLRASAGKSMKSLGSRLEDPAMLPALVDRGAGGPFYLPRVGNEKTFPQAEEMASLGITSLAVLPVGESDDPWAVLVLYSEAPMDFDRRQRVLIEAVAAQTSLALERARRYVGTMALRLEKRRVVRMLDLIVSFLRQPDLGGEPETITAALADVANRIWGVSLVLMWTVDEDSDQLQLASVSGADSSKAEGVLRVDEPFVKELMDGGKPVVVKDLSRETGWGNRELLDITAHEALLGAPIVVDGRPVGVFVFLGSNPDRFTPWDESVLEIFARHLATAWEVSLTRGALKETKEKLILTERFELLAKSAVGKAHDFNNFLGLVLGNLYLLRPRLDPSDREAFRIIDVMEQTIMGATNTIKSFQELTSKTAESPRVVTPSAGRPSHPPPGGLPERGKYPAGRGFRGHWARQQGRFPALQWLGRCRL